MKYVIVALVFAFSATGADAHDPARAHHARYKHHSSTTSLSRGLRGPQLLGHRRRHRRRVYLGCVQLDVAGTPLLVIERGAGRPVTSPGLCLWIDVNDRRA